MRWGAIARRRFHCHACSPGVNGAANRRGVAVAVLGTLLTAGCGAAAGVPLSRAAHVAKATFSHVGLMKHRGRDERHLVALLSGDQYRQAGIYIGRVTVESLKEAEFPTTVVLESLREELPAALPAKARIAAAKSLRAALPRIAALGLERETEFNHEAELRREAKEAEVVYPVAVRRPVLRVCDRERTAALCECALRHLEAQTPLAQFEGEVAAASRRLLGWIAKCELQEAAVPGA